METDSKISRLSLQSLQTLQFAFEQFIDLITPPERDSVREFVAFAESILGDDPALTAGESGGMNVVACARANPSTVERDMAALRAFKDVLRGLVLAEAVIGEETVTYADFFADLRGALETASFSLPAQSGVMAASVLDGRGLSFQPVVLMGLSEGEFPKQEREDILLRERERAALRERGLPLEPRLHGDEGTLFYQAVTRARKKLLLTRPYLAEDGQPWEASPYWEEIRCLNGNPVPGRVRLEDGLDLAEAASHVEWREAAWVFDINLKNGVEDLTARLAPKGAGKFEGEIFDLRERFGTEFGWSASKLESYGTCPFEFFVAYGLGLEPRDEPEEGFDVRALGSMLHKILEESYRGADLQETAGRVFSTAPRDYGFRPTPLWELQKAELLWRLEETVAALAEVLQGWRPFKQELKFGMGAPSLVLETEAGPVRLHMFKIAGQIYGDPADDGSGMLGTKNETLYRINQFSLREKSKFSYVYDFGDSWSHTILVEKITSTDPSAYYPVCVPGKRACTPEDVGDIWGYADFLEAIADSTHEEHDEMLEWAGGEYDPEGFDLVEVNEALRFIKPARGCRKS